MGALEAVLAEISEQVDEEAERMKRECARYADLIVSGTHPSEPVSGWNEALPEAKRFADKIANAWRLSLGRPANPYHPAQEVAYRVFDRIYGDEFVGLDAIYEAAYANGRRGQRFQVESRIHNFTLRNHGFKLDKGKVDGRVAYRIVKESE